jgi:diguanylate cyclase (GGDEF)-like protein
VNTEGIPVPGGWQDALTGLEGPDFWAHTVAAEVARALRYRRPLTVVLAELEGIDDLVRMWGPEIGGIAVRDAAQSLRRTSRSSDHCTRIRAARFGIVLTETDEIAAINFVERVREAGPGSDAKTGNELSFVFGWASPKIGESPESVIRRAERRLESELAGAQVSAGH